MGRFIENWRVPAATFFSVALIAGAYALAQGVATPPVAVASEESALLYAIATRDADADGLPDWEEALYGTDPKNPDSRNLGMTDGQAVARGLVVPKAIADVPTATSTPWRGAGIDSSIPVPADGTLTDTFAKSFFTLYLSAVKKSPNGNLSESDTRNIATEALAKLAQSVTLSSDYKSPQDITVVGSGPDVMRAYAVTAEAVFLVNKATASKSEIFYLKDILENNDTSAPAHISSIAKGYRSTATGLAVLPVPAELASNHLALINAMAHLAEIIEDFTRVDSDPLATMLALQLYPEAVLDLGNSFIRLHGVYESAGVTFKTGEQGASLVNLIVNVAADQEAAKKL